MSSSETGKLRPDRKPEWSGGLGSGEGDRVSKASGLHRARFPYRFTRGKIRLLAGILGVLLFPPLTSSAVFAAENELWGFEQVTPPIKGAGTVAAIDTFRASPDGNSLLYSAASPFESVPSASAPRYVRYLGFRGENGWENRSVDLPWRISTDTGLPLAIQVVVGSSRDLSHVLAVSTKALVPGAIAGGGNLYMRNTRTGELTLVAAHADSRLATSMASTQGGLNVKYVSNDGREALFRTAVPLTPGAPDGYQDPGNPFSALYSWTASDGLQLESVLPLEEGGAGSLITYAGNDFETGPRYSIPESEGLSNIYFTSLNAGGIGPLYRRANGVTTPVSVSEITEIVHRARVEAIGPEGKFVLFTVVGSNVRLTEDTPTIATAAVRHVYRYEVGEGLTYIGTLNSESSANGTGVVQMSQDGRSIAFQSTLALTGEATAGRANLYVWRDGDLKFVSTADSGSSRTSGARFGRVMSRNGRFLYFTDNSVSTAAQFGYDNSTTTLQCPGALDTIAARCNQVYLYDIDAEELECVSCRPDGMPANGHSGESGSFAPGYMRMDAHRSLNVADDGTVFFNSREPLVAEDSNGEYDVYRYRDGELQLVSRAAQGHSARFLDATPDGKTVFFSTTDPIVATDRDNAVDIYMTRAGAGFDGTPVIEPVPCSGSDCREPGAESPAAPIVATSGIDGDGNVFPSRSATTPIFRIGKARTVAGSMVRLRVRVPGAGRVFVTGSAIRRANTSVSKAGTYGVKVRLTPRGRKALEKRGRLKVKVRVQFRSKDGRSGMRATRIVFKRSQGARSMASKGGS